MSQINATLKKGFLLLFFMTTGFLSWSQMSYEEFHAKYEPHFQKIAPSLQAVTVVNEADAETGALAIQLLMQQADEGDEDSKLKVIAILTSCDRKVVAKALKAMPTDKAIEALNYVKFDWQVEIMYFVDRETYQNLAPYCLAMLVYDGPKGPFGPELGNFAPAYAGVGFDFGWGGFKGINRYIESYNAWTSKGNSPVYYLDTPVSELGTYKGFAAFAGFNISNKGFLEVNYQNRTAKGIGGGENPETWTKEFKFNTHTLGIMYLKSKEMNRNKTFRFVQGWGLQFQTGGVSERNSISNPSWRKVGSDFTAGITYNPGFFINPIKNLPLIFGVRGYAQFNLLGHDAVYLETDNPQLPWANASGLSYTEEDFKSVMNTFGIQMQVAYRFGKPDTREFIDFDTELAQTYDKNINTTYTEILPIVSPDGKTLYFIRADHPLNTNGSYASQDIWVADISNGLNSQASRLTAPFNQNKYNMIAGVSPDGNAMVIKGLYDEKKDVWDRGYSIIYRTKNGWTEPKSLDIKSYNDMSKGIYTGAYWTQDGKHLILSFSEKSGDDLQDLYVSHLQEDGTYSRPEPLGSTINGSETDDHSPFMASDGKTLYYSSDREGSLGGNDIWMTKRLDDTWTNWSEPVNLGSDVNTEEWDAYYSIDAQGKYAYMASSKNSVGQEDIVRIKLKEEVQPDPVVLVKGKVLNKKTGEPLDATLSYNGLVDGVNYGVARTNPATGEYTIVLPYGVNYEFTTLAKDFIGISDNLDLTKIGEYKEIEKDLYLVPIEVGATVRLNNIFFETGKSELKKESYSELNRVVKFLNDNPTVKIELSGHTDNVGDKGMNKSLSQKRADAVMAYLTQQGIDASRLVAKGYGMEKPVADNATDEGKALNRRVEFTILEN